MGSICIINFGWDQFGGRIVPPFFQFIYKFPEVLSISAAKFLTRLVMQTYRYHGRWEYQRHTIRDITSYSMTPDIHTPPHALNR